MSTKKLELRIEELELRLEEEISVKKSEVLMNYDLKCYNKSLEIQIGELVRINESFLDKVVKLRAAIVAKYEE